MAGKIIEARAPITLTALNRAVQKKYTGVTFAVPDLEDEDGRPVVVEVAMLKSGEREHIIAASNLGEPSFNPSMWNRLTVAYGLVKPDLMKEYGDDAERAAEMLKQYPDDFIIPVAKRIWELTDAYRTKREKGADEPAPFRKSGSASSSSPTASTNSPAT